MASRRKLKKGIKEITDFLIDDILFISLDAKVGKKLRYRYSLFS